MTTKPPREAAAEEFGKPYLDDGHEDFFLVATAGHLAGQRFAEGRVIEWCEKYIADYMSDINSRELLGADDLFAAFKREFAE